MEPEATGHTDGWRSYLTPPNHGYRHERAIVYEGHHPAHAFKQTVRPDRRTR